MRNIGTSSASGYLTAIELIEAFKKKNDEDLGFYPNMGIECEVLIVMK
jgi:hypothetical protein